MDTDEEVQVRTCCSCTSEMAEDEGSVTSDNENVCDDCAWCCEHCESVKTAHDDMYTVESEVWCHHCKQNDAHYCDNCSEYYTGYVYGADDTDDTFCESCYSDVTSYCEECDCYYRYGCEINHDEENDDSRIIHDYSYRPDPRFWMMPEEDTRLYFGIEIEAEVRGQDYSDRTAAAEYAAHNLENRGLAYLKNDGSLECGFEIVTHPMTHAYHMQESNPLWEVVTNLKSRFSMMSWGTKTCGLHVHISRRGFTGGSHMHRFLQLVYNNKNFYEVLAGRSSSHWAKFDDIYDNNGQKSFRHKLNDRRDSDRYSAVNTLNRATLEMRIFRGSLNPRFIKSAIDLAHASVEFTRVMSVKEVREGGLSCLNFRQYIESKPDLYPSLIERIHIHKDMMTRIERSEHVPVGSLVTE